MTNDFTTSDEGNLEDLLQRAVEQQLLANFLAASDLYEKALKIQEDHSDAMELLAAVAVKMKQYKKALRLLNSDVLKKKNTPSICNNRGVSLMHTGRMNEAIENFNQAIKLRKNYAAAYSNLGIARKKLNQIAAALESYNQSIEISSEFADPYFNRGVLLEDLGYPELAFDDYRTAIEIEPDFIDALYNTGNLLYKKNAFAKALTYYEAVLKIDDTHDKALYNGGMCLQALGFSGEALNFFTQATHVNPLQADSHYRCGILLNQMNQPKAALRSLENVIQLAPDFPYIAGAIANIRLQMCDWHHMDNEISEILDEVAQDKQVAPPFPVLSMTDSLALQKKAAEIWVGHHYPENRILGEFKRRTFNEKIRIAYFSADFYNHATTHLIARLFRDHDRDKFEIIGFSFGPKVNDAIATSLPGCFDRFLDVREKTDQEIAALARSVGIDIAIDLKGFTRHHRFGIFSYRAAPLQVAYLGYPGTTAAPYMDYLIADTVIIPEARADQYTEKIIYLPDSYQINDMPGKMSDTIFTRAQCGLPDTGFVFACFNINHKFNSQTFSVWMDILRKVKGSVLWLLEDNYQAAANLRSQAESLDVDPERLVFAERIELSDHLARHQLADLFLDTWPYGGHTTASDALWAGLPVLTRIGESFASRVAASLLAALDLHDLVTDTPAAYARLAIELATDTQKLATLKAKLAKHRSSHALFNTSQTTRQMEAAFVSIMARYQRGLAPDSVHVGVADRQKTPRTVSN
jgi:predicted O-linked N-acetylglucosamine transferase (SPINDLY family)